MRFDTLEFTLLFLPIVVTGFYLVRRWGHAHSLVLLALASLVFYGWWGAQYVPSIAGLIRQCV